MPRFGGASRAVTSRWARATYLMACGVLLGSVWAMAPAASAQVDLPVIPDPVAVELDHSTTAYLLLDMVDAICPARPSCPGTVPAATSLLTRARDAGALVVHTTGRAGGTQMPGLEPLPSERIVGAPADKFFGTDLDDILVSHGIRTVVIAGTAANGAPMYTTFGANLRGYTAVVVSDVLPGQTPFDTFLTQYQVLNEPGFDNPNNTPLVEGRVTLSRSDLITFR